MGWVKLDDNFFRNPKVLEISGEAKLLYLAGLCYAGASLTDGFIPKNAVRSLAADADVSANSKRVKELLDAGLWEENPRGYGIHDYLEHNTSADDVRKKREQARARAQKNRGKFAESSREVPANDSESSREVRQPETETETETPEAKASGEGATAPAPRLKTKRTSNSKIPEDFTVTDEMRQWAAEAVPDVSSSEIATETEKFIDHFTGNGVKKVDWVATWRNWIRRSQDFKPKQPANVRQFQNGKKSDSYTIAELMAMGEDSR